MAKKKPTPTKKPAPVSSSRPAAKAKAPTTLQNLAAKPATFDDEADDQLVDHSGVFRVTTAITRSQQTSREEESSLRFASESLVMAAQRDGFREDGTTLEDAAEEGTIEDEATTVAKRQRLATLAARNQARTRGR